MKKKLLSAIVAFILLFSCTLPLNTYANEETGYWERTNIIDRKVDTSKVEKSEGYSPTWVYGRGHYTYRCEVTYEGIWYSGKDHDKCNGEYVESTARVATPEKYYLGGEQVVLHTSIRATTSGKICFHLGASVGSFITFVNKDDPFTSYGTDTSLYDITEKHTKSYLATYKNDTNTGYEGMSADMGAKMPQGSSEGDKVYIVTGLGGGNESMQTAYEYTWHTTGGENAVKMREEYNAKIKEERILEAWKNRQKEKEKLPEPDPNYKDSGLRASDLWGQCAIRRGDQPYDSEWEYLTPDTIIYFGDEIKTWPDSGVVLSLTDMSTFLVRENTHMILPGPETRVSAVKILWGNVVTNVKKMIYGGEMNIEMQQAVAGIKGTTFAAEQTDELSTFYLFTSSADITSKITGEKITLKPGEYAEVDNNGMISVKTFDIPSKAKELSWPMEILEDDGYKANGDINIARYLWIILPVAGIIAVIVVTALIVSKKKKAAQQMTEYIPATGAYIPDEYGGFESPIPSGRTEDKTQTNQTIPQKKFCTNCGAQVAPDARFCVNCGGKLI